MQSYIGTAGYPVMLFNMASRDTWFSALHRHHSGGGVVDAARPLLPAMLQAEAARRPTRHFIADILGLRDDDDDHEEMKFSRTASSTGVPLKHVDVSGSDGGVWTSMSPSPPSLSSNADDVTTSPDSEPPQRCAEDLRLLTRHHSFGSESCTSHTPPSSSDVDVDYMSDHGTYLLLFLLLYHDHFDRSYKSELAKLRISYNKH